MSKLSEQLRIEATANRYVDVGSINCLTVEENFTKSDIAYLQEYSIEARLGVKVVVKDTIALHHVKDNAIAVILEEVFGEFRLPLYKANLAIAQRDYDKAMAIIKEISTSMFKE